MVQQREDLDEIAYRAIIRMILDNAYRPGDFLLETELAAKLSLSRTPVSHALGRLVAEGFLEKRRKKGCTIPQPSADDARRVFQARQAIERELASLAATEATEVEIDALRQVVSQQSDAAGEHCKESYTLLNEQFHFLVARASHNPYLERYCRHAFWRSNVYIFFFDAYYQRDDGDLITAHTTPRQHQEVYEAIAERNRIKAADLMAEHIHTTLRKLSKPYS